jgi:hypothetical protein
LGVEGPGRNRDVEGLRNGGFWDGGRPHGPLAVRTRIAMGLWMRVGPELCNRF